MKRSQAPSQLAKKTKTTTQPKKTNQRAVLRTQSIARNVVSNAGFPPTILFSHRLFLQGGITTSTTLQAYRISVNGLFNPDFTGGSGAQPMFFDQLTPIYNHYRVLGSRIRWQIVNLINNNMATRIGVYLNDDTSAVPSGQAAIEHRTGQHQILPCGNDSKVVFEQKWSINEYFPRQKFDDELKGTPAANPNEQMYFLLHARPMDNTTAVSIQFTAVIDYITEWSEIKDVTSS